MRTNGFRLDEKRPFAGIIKYAIPILIASVLQQFYNTADLFILGVFDSQRAMASVGACGFLIGLIITFASGLSSGISVSVSTELGKEDKGNIKSYVQNGFIIVFILGICIAIFAYLAGPIMLSDIIGVPAELLNEANVYIKICAIGVLFEFLYNYIMGLLLGHGDSKASLLFLSISTVINITLDIALVSVWHMGVVGVALSTVIAQFILVICATIYLTKKYPEVFASLNTRDWLVLPGYIWDIIRVGVPLSFQGIVVNLGFMIIQNTVNSFGSDMTASYAVASKLEMYLLIPFISFTSALAVYVGFLIGNHRDELLTRVLSRVRIAYLVIAVILAAFSFAMAPAAAYLFKLNTNASSIFISHFRMIAIDIIIYSLYSPVNAFFGGSKRSYIMFICSCVEMTGRIMAINLLAKTIGMACVWFSEPIPWLFVCIGMNITYLQLRKRDCKKYA